MKHFWCECTVYFKFKIVTKLWVLTDNFECWERRGGERKGYVFEKTFSKAVGARGRRRRCTRTRRSHTHCAVVEPAPPATVHSERWRARQAIYLHRQCVYTKGIHTIDIRGQRRCTKAYMHSHHRSGRWRVMGRGKGLDILLPALSVSAQQRHSLTHSLTHTHN